jgi:hypothetical protein
MVNLLKVMTQPYMIAGNLAKSVICGVGDIVTDILPCGNNNSNRNPFKKDATEDRDDSTESGGGGNPLNFFGGKKGKNTKYEDFTWNQLPRGARNAAETLGLDQSTWDAKGWSQTEEKSWSGLTSDERDAATTLGWDKSAWDHKYNDKNWSDLPGNVQSAAQNLGFTQQMWDNDQWPAVGAAECLQWPRRPRHLGRVTARSGPPVRASCPTGSGRASRALRPPSATGCVHVRPLMTDGWPALS